MNKIPKLIHHIAPKDKSKWHPLWKDCYDSWKKNFDEKEYTFNLWNDEDDIDNLVKNYFPEYFEFYSKLPYHMCKIDFAIFCILYKYGGIFSDMDVFCYKNFYDNLDKNLEVSVLESTNDDEIVVNALMVSKSQHQFFMNCIEESKNMYDYFEKNKEKIDPKLYDIKYYARIVCGPYTLSKVFENYQGEKVSFLEKKFYNPHVCDYNIDLRTKHMLTGMWGKESELFLKLNNSSFRDSYYDKHNIDCKNFNFYKKNFKNYKYC